MMGRLKTWARHIKRDVVALWLAGRDARIAWYVKALAAGVAVYALSPIDLIPDFVPILGYLDDLVIVPLGIIAVVKLIPAPIMAELREQAMGFSTPKSAAGLIAVLLIWAATAGLTIWYLWPFY